jgi:ribokinase
MSLQPLDILGIGDLDVDIYVRVPRLAGNDEKIHGTPAGMFAGGMIGNFCCAASRLGQRVGMHAVVGDDAFGAQTIQGLAEFDVNARGVRVKPGQQTYFCVIQLDDSGEKALTLARTPMIFPSSNDLDHALIASARLVHMAPFDIGVATEAAQIARAANVAVSVDLEPGSVSEGLTGVERLLANTDVCVVNEFALIDLFGTGRLDEGAEHLRGRGPSIVLVTRGARGVTVFTAGGPLSIPGITADVVDTTGAGDACAAAFLSGWLEGWPLEDAARFGCAAGALATRAIGARSSLPTRDEALAAIGRGAAPTVHGSRR